MSNITRRESNSLYRTMKSIHDILTINNIPYWMVGGTLLGAIRHQGIIPWDDDGDIAIMKKDIPKFKRLGKIFEDNGLRLAGSEEDVCKRTRNDIESVCCYKNQCTFVIEGSQLNCDVFIMIPDSEHKDRITFADPYWAKAPNGGKKCYFLTNHLFPLIPLKFGNFYMYAPNNSILHLNTCYGPDWNSKSMMMFNHRTGVWASGEKHKLKPEDYLAIEPPKDTKDETVPESIHLKYKNRKP